MITIINARDLDGNVITKKIPSDKTQTIDAKGLTLFPATIDGHVHFRTPGLEKKENWKTGAKAALRGGVTTVFDMPNTIPTTTTLSALEDKHALIESQLKEASLPLRHYFYFGATPTNSDLIPFLKDQAIGIKVFMGSSTGSLLVSEEDSLRKIFSQAAKAKKIVALHAEDEQMIQERSREFASSNTPRTHSLIRSPEVAAKAVSRAIALAKETGCSLYFLHISTEQELELIAKAKQEGLPIFAEATPHHLFLSTEDYDWADCKVQVNPPLRDPHHQRALWDALIDGTIDTIGSDHAPHPLSEKLLPYGHAPSGVPGVETTLPLILTACKQKKLTFSRALELLKTRIEEMFALPLNDDYLLVDLETEQSVKEEEIASLAGWSPYSSWRLVGWPSITIAKGKVITHERNSELVTR